MSWIRIWVHLVFSTKNREAFFTSRETREKLIEHIKTNAKKKDIWLEEINGDKDHLHCLISLGRDQTISKISQLIKGESSKWINDEKLTKAKFSWQDDYWAVSASESHLKSVKEYIRNQEEHHKTKSFTEEVDDFMKKYGWEYVK
ncbi:MAG: IS200/IS605 family transposase [Melioribacteraceae bacterium]|nr:IS200/IS605 family transposase [Melioribacteraceae bacterium]MCF8354481.1 IS200/IS605 family transposase [Melioribacteraceae bacterium]MCF8394091.1 IS200/IS605 family transposase [Melioribacteraceae bacterium]MCF8419857.1 IS200/IS605 family transposase [Melioribacteraceae bacterium]